MIFGRAPQVAVLIPAPVVSGVGLAYVVSLRGIPDVSNHVNSNVAVPVKRTCAGHVASDAHSTASSLVG